VSIKILAVKKKYRSLGEKKRDQKRKKKDPGTCHAQRRPAVGKPIVLAGRKSSVFASSKQTKTKTPEKKKASSYIEEGGKNRFKLRILRQYGMAKRGACSGSPVFLRGGGIAENVTWDNRTEGGLLLLKAIQSENAHASGPSSLTRKVDLVRVCSRNLCVGHGRSSRRRRPMDLRSLLSSGGTFNKSWVKTRDYSPGKPNRSEVLKPADKRGDEKGGPHFLKLRLLPDVKVGHVQAFYGISLLCVL